MRKRWRPAGGGPIESAARPGGVLRGPRDAPPEELLTKTSYDGLPEAGATPGQYSPCQQGLVWHRSTNSATQHM
ncbi:unnamed protein product [Lampetra planeri]